MRTLALLTLSALLLATSAAAQTPEEARAITQLLGVYASQDDRIEVTTAEDIKKVVELEAEKAALGCDIDSASCLAEVAGAMGTRYVIIGELSRLGSLVILTMNLFDSTQAKSVKRQVAQGTDVGKLVSALSPSVQQLLSALQFEEDGRKLKLLVLEVEPLTGKDDSAVVGEATEDKREAVNLDLERKQLEDEQQRTRIAMEQARIAEEKAKVEAERQLAEEKAAKAKAELERIEAEREAEAQRQRQAERDRKASEKFWSGVWDGVGSSMPWVIGTAGFALMISGPVMWGIKDATGAYPIPGVDQDGEYIIAGVALLVGGIMFFWVVGPWCIEVMDDMDLFDDDAIPLWLGATGILIMLTGPIFWGIEDATGEYPFGVTEVEDQETVALIAAVIGGSLLLGALIPLME